MRKIFDYIYFLKTILKYNKLNKTNGFPIKFSNLRPIISERFDEAGKIDSHYFHQDIWAAQKILKNNPLRHIDIGSRLDGFISHLLVFREVEYVDIRPLKTKINNLKFIQDDATSLSSFKDNSIESFSCLHAAEHFGLGRYNDPVDPTSYEKLIFNIQRTIKSQGKLYFSVPIGKEKVQFNAHRIFNPKTILKLFNNMTLISFSYIGDDGKFYENTVPDNLEKANYSCGLFEFKKK